MMGKEKPIVVPSLTRDDFARATNPRTGRITVSRLVQVMQEKKSKPTPKKKEPPNGNS